MDSEKIKEGVRLILSGIGEDINREGLTASPGCMRNWPGAIPTTRPST